ncbi:ABC transporter permease [Flammeovirga yaeyamensis]|uniref:ABC transporter permease n=1 Tax=Flammeovirga yaeyamensis TaxID=367791 RepID=A0AAX1N3N1_9BACT|nr:ABC transporter permease [Flammeovirga yaeyamensis]MBB3700615.1 ABC-type antimicrobial peptide transport system permease subunit [Flammeovirga yaeyamensis]NMF37731.1 hypothetical protein [Flammeovirga yaeyamensis]QWG02040.1 ABC transporter permease [Flammeovirga yaeyamensis]
MYKLYLSLAIRNLIKNYQNTIINLLGLSLGLASALFVFLFYQSESNFDNFFDEDIYRMNYEMSVSGGNSLFTPLCSYPHGVNYQEKFDNVTDYATVYRQHNISYFYFKNEKIDNVKAIAAENNYFQFFNIPLLEGNEKTVLNDKKDVLLSASFAKKYFGNIPVIGQEVEFKNDTFIVKGIFQDLPINSHVQYDIIYSINSLKSKLHTFYLWEGVNIFNLYLKFQHQEEIPSTLAQINQLLSVKFSPFGINNKATIQHIKEIHFDESGLSYNYVKSRSYESFLIIIVVGITILSLALFNFIVLYSVQKDKEITSLTLMKIFGAHQKDLIRSTCLEISLLLLVATGISFIFLYGMLPFLNEQLNAVVSLRQYLKDIVIFYFIIGILLTISLSYLSLRRVSKVSLAKSLSGQTQLFSSKNRTEKGLLVIQFLIVFSIVSIGITIYQQYQHLLISDYGFDYSNTLVLKLNSNDKISNQKLENFKEEIKKIADVDDIMLSNEMIGLGEGKNSSSIFVITVGASKKEELANILHADDNHLDFFNIQLKEGRLFDKNKQLSTQQCIVNEAFKKFDGWDGIGTKVVLGDETFEVVGILQPLSINSLIEETGPLLLTTSDEDGWDRYYVNIKYNSDNPIGLVEQLEDLWEQYFPNIRSEILFYDQELQQNYAAIQGQQKAGSFFGIISLLIATSGLWGITRFSVLQRKKEMSIRKVNGASRLDILMLFNKDYLQWILLAFLISLPISHYFCTQWLSNFPDRIEINFLIWGTLAFGILLMSISTITLICWKVVNINPSKILRDL